jgi:acyl-CoA reductase-like NAD-dependent aldehyde dehydrogenase
VGCRPELIQGYGLGGHTGVGRVAEFDEGLRVGNGLDPETQIGPLVSEQQLERVTGCLSVARQEGARAVAGGEQLTEGPFAKGFFLPPTVFADVRDDMRIAQEEIFGPVISAIPFTDVEEVIRRGNATTFGLGRAYGRATSAKRTGWRRGCALDRCGSIATRRWTQPSRSVATR